MKRWLLLALLVARAACAVLPTPAEVKAAYRASDAQLLDRHGQPIESVRIDLHARRTAWVPLADISPALGMAVMQAEDQRFMEHGGIDLKAAGQAAWDNLFRSRPRGASTITMQLAALLDPSLRASGDGRSMAQKLKQAFAARELEAGWSKQQILEAYLNLVGWRGELVGIGAASQGLFGKAPSGLTRSEAAILASLLRAPGAPVRTVAARACALAREIRSADDCAAVTWQAEVALGRPGEQAVLQPSQAIARKLLGTGAGPVKSTLDASLQRFAGEALHRHLAELAERNVGQGAVLVIDNASGEILAWVGNAGGSEVDGVTALRQAGSTLKPFLYQLAIERGLLTAASLLDDSPVDIAAGSGGLYVPQNYDKGFKGYTSVRTSLASSLNVPAVRTLMLTGLDRFYERLRELGIDSLTESANFYGYSLALGSGDVSLLALTNAYRTLANGGAAGSVTLRSRAPEAKRRLLDPRASFIVADILSDRGARSVTFGLSNELATGFWAAVKTGTSKDMRDNWCVGFSDRYTVGVWVGNFDGQPMWDVSGVSGAAPVWRDVMDYLHRGRPGRAPAAPPGLLRQTVAFRPAVEPERAEWFVRGTEIARVELVPPGARLPDIVYPVDGSILAVDPDIPEARERVLFQAQAGAGLSFRLDGEVLGGAAESYAWRPRIGEHKLELVDAAGTPGATVRFEVRGSERRAAP
ncbi:penicillin-binding protein 1C [Massilia terrae]|uniref:peptidoglycan glycosyltransferase n=1 Tax=Massilia terrae TaxID=1811224 RepID=A0ABT2CZI0_9BURK|nr:penicillin-binding protein 1C [Massilia terrae]MCS0659384.1 penicillin-binding protein 1C [Massilia terrae]